ncbi:MAG: pentapeptide repeat-containing protein [Leptolyngbya sp. BL-A-14]
MSHQHYAKQSLQNRSFKGLDLTGADFSGADLHGCNFSGATLVGANFTGARTGQSPQQVRRSVMIAIVAPGAMVGLSFLIVQIPMVLFGDRVYQGLNVVVGWLPLLLLPLELFFQDTVTRRFPQATNLLGVAGVAILFQVMVTFTLGLAIISVNNFGDSGGGQGFFLLVLAIIAAIVTHRLFKWLVDAIQSSGGTSFRKANLTDANLSHAVIQNTDFCFAVLTGACVFAWVVQRHTQFANVTCEYLYLEPEYQKRHPIQGKLRQGEAEDYLTRAKSAHLQRFSIE